MSELKKLLVNNHTSLEPVIKLWETRGWQLINSESSLINGANILTFKQNAR